MIELPRRPGALPGVLAAALIAGAACTAGDAASGVDVQRADSSGVEIVTSNGAEVPLDWTFEPRLTIGDDDSGEASFAALHHEMVAVDDSGRIIVLDGQNHRIIVFASDGQHLHTFGKEGGGPGEMQFPLRLALDGDGNIVVFDVSKRELLRYATDGTLLPGIARPEDGAITDIAFSGRWPVISRREGSGDDFSVESIRVLRDSTSEEITRFIHPASKMVMYESCKIGMAMGPMFQPQVLWEARGGRVVASGTGRYVIDVFDGTSQVASFRRAVEPVATTPEMASRELEGGMRVQWSGGACTIAPEEVIEKRGMAPTLPALSRLELAPDGTIWAARGIVKGDTALVDVFSETGEYRGTLPRGAPMPAAFFPNGDILAIEKDELDVPRLAVYRVNRRNEWE